MPSTVIFDADCGLCQRIRRMSEGFDWFGSLRWIPLQDPAALDFGIAREELERAMWIITRRGRRYQGFAAVKQILLRLPATYGFSIMAIRKRPLLAAPIALFFAPFFEPVGRRAYDWVASNRNRLLGTACQHMGAGAQM